MADLLQKWRAYRAVQYALETGELERPTHCQNCGKKGRNYTRTIKGKKRKVYSLQAHHHMGYSKRQYLNVVWLCGTCHAQEAVK